MDNLNYFQIRNKGAEDYIDFLHENYLDLYKEFREEKVITERLDKSNKEKDILLNYSEASTAYYKDKNEQDAKKFEKDLKKERLQGTIKTLGVGTGALVIGYVIAIFLN